MTLVLHIRKGDWRCQLGRGGPHTCISVVFGGPRTDCANLFPASAAPVEDVRYTLINDAAPVLWQIRGRCSSGYGQHAWAWGNWQEMHVHLAGSRNSWPHRSAMWQEERTTMWLCTPVITGK